IPDSTSALACARRTAFRTRVQKRGQVAQVVERSPEKAGVGGSTPSLATIISKDLAKDYVFLPVRSQSVCAEGDETGRCTLMISSNFVRTCYSSVIYKY